MSVILNWWKGLFGPKVKKPELINPLNASPGSFVEIGLAEYDDTNCNVISVRQVSRRINGNDYKFADYYLLGLDREVKLRVVPDGNGNNQILLLELTEDMIYNKELHDICKNESEFHVEDSDNSTESVYWRIGDVTCSQNAVVTFTNNGKEEKYDLEYWDWSRITKDEADQDYEEFLFVEMDKNSGRMQIWQGKVVETSRVTVYNAK